MSKDDSFSKIMRGLQEAHDIATGEDQPARVHIARPVSGGIDYDLLHKAVARRYPVILAKLADND